MNWSDLSMSQRSELMSIYLKNGITSLDEMKKHYNNFAEGGSIDNPPYKRYYATPQYGFSPENSDLNTYNLEQQVIKETAAKKAKSEKERRERREYIREHPEKYANRRKSTGNKINHVQGSEHSNAKITEEITYLIKLDMKNGVKRKETLERFNIPVTIYKDIQRGKTWKHIKIEENYDKDKETK